MNNNFFLKVAFRACRVVDINLYMWTAMNGNLQPLGESTEAQIWARWFFQYSGPPVYCSFDIEVSDTEIQRSTINNIVIIYHIFCGHGGGWNSSTGRDVYFFLFGCKREDTGGRSFDIKESTSQVSPLPNNTLTLLDCFIRRREAELSYYSCLEQQCYHHFLPNHKPLYVWRKRI